MKSSKENGLHKFVSFLLIAILLIFVVGFAVNGWQEDTKEPDSGDDGGKTDNTDENTDGNQTPDTEDPGNEDDNTAILPDDNQNEPTPPVEDEIIKDPVYINTMTGLETSCEQAENIPLGFVVNPLHPLYGISSSDLTIEFPTENGNTRMLSYTTDNALLWKIGSLVETRAFISGMSNFFGGVVISYGNDDLVKYSAWETSKIELDLSKQYNSYFVENTLYIYTSGEKVDEALTENPQIKGECYKTPPFLFASAEIKGTTNAERVIIPYSSSSETQLYFSEKTGKYLYYKSGSRKVDMLTGKNIAFDNVFVLFANATTYEKANGSELVIDTLAGGTGYYITKGTLMEIKWYINENGEMKFSTLAGEALSVNKGSSYFSYYKASCSSDVKVN